MPERRIKLILLEGRIQAGFMNMKGVINKHKISSQLTQLKQHKSERMKKKKSTYVPDQLTSLITDSHIIVFITVIIQAAITFLTSTRPSIH